MRIMEARKNIFFAAALGLCALATGIPAQAQQSQASTWWCYASEARVSLDQQISGCSTEILSGTLSNSDLAIAYFNRGLAYSAKGQFKRAIQDYTYGRSLARAKKGDKKGADADLAAARWLSSITRELSELPPIVAQQVAGFIGGAVRSVRLAPRSVRLAPRSRPRLRV